MKIYTKGGDKGTTSLIQSKNLSKSDDRIGLVGTIDELTSNLGLVKTMLKDSHTIECLEEVQRTLITLMAGVADPYNRDYRIAEDKTLLLEREIDGMESGFDRPKEFILPGGTPLSAQIDVARTVCRRAERALALVSVRYGADQGSKMFLNRLADYLYILARREDALAAGLAGAPSAQGFSSAPEGGSSQKTRDASGLDLDAAVKEVLKAMGIVPRITLESAKRLMEQIEEEAKRRGQKAVIAVCGPDGNPIAVHVMDGAFLVSFDVALKKAYTSVAVKMSTMELSRLAQPGQTFYGLDKMDGGKIVIFGGGVPLKAGGEIIGGLGISGGTGEEDHGLCEYALSILQDVLF